MQCKKKGGISHHFQRNQLYIQQNNDSQKFNSDLLNDISLSTFISHYLNNTAYLFFFSSLFSSAISLQKLFFFFISLSGENHARTLKIGDKLRMKNKTNM